MMEVQPTSLPAPKEWIDEAESCDDVEGEYEEATLKLAQKHVGECLWLATKTCPDIMFVTTHAASLVSKRPSYVIRLSKRVLAYLAGTVDLRMTMGPGNEEDALELVAFTDASYAPYGRRSFGAAVITLAGAPVAWKSGRQSFITVMEAELYAATQGCTLLKSVQALVAELFPTALTCVLAVDNTSAAAMLAGGPGSQRTRHLKIRANYVREEVEQGRLIVCHTPGSMQLADLSTKMQSKLRLHQLLQLWGFVGFATNVLQEMKLKILAALMVLAQCICPARAQANESKEPLPTTTWDEAVVMMVVVAIVAVLVWEALRFGYRRILRCRRRWLKAKRLEQVSQFASAAARREIATTTTGREAMSSVRRRSTRTRSRSSTPIAPMTPRNNKGFHPSEDDEHYKDPEYSSRSRSTAKPAGATSKLFSGIGEALNPTAVAEIYQAGRKRGTLSCVQGYLTADDVRRFEIRFEAGRDACVRCEGRLD